MRSITQWLRNMSYAAACRAGTALLVFLAGLLVVRLAISLLRRALQAAKLEKVAQRLIISLARVILWLMLLLSIAASLGIDVTGIVALAGVLTIAISLALQNMLTNVLGGLTLLSTHPFSTGDYIEIGSYSGTVKEITMTYTRLETPDNKQISIPNSSVVTAQIVNYTSGGIRRVEVNIRTLPDDEPSEVTDALLRAGIVDGVLTEPKPEAVILGVVEGTAEYSLRLWVKPENYWEVFFAVNRKVLTVFRAQRIRLSGAQFGVRGEGLQQPFQKHQQPNAGNAQDTRNQDSDGVNRYHD